MNWAIFFGGGGKVSAGRCHPILAGGLVRKGVRKYRVPSPKPVRGFPGIWEPVSLRKIELKENPNKLVCLALDSEGAGALGPRQIPKFSSIARKICPL